MTDKLAELFDENEPAESRSGGTPKAEKTAFVMWWAAGPPPWRAVRRAGRSLPRSIALTVALVLTARRRQACAGAAGPRQNAPIKIDNRGAPPSRQFGTRDTDPGPFSAMLEFPRRAWGAHLALSRVRRVLGDPRPGRRARISFSLTDKGRWLTGRIIYELSAAGPARGPRRRRDGADASGPTARTLSGGAGGFDTEAIAEDGGHALRRPSRRANRIVRLRLRAASGVAGRAASRFPIPPGVRPSCPTNKGSGGVGDGAEGPLRSAARCWRFSGTRARPAG